jgi:hypothetical protein
MVDSCSAAVAQWFLIPDAPMLPAMVLAVVRGGGRANDQAVAYLAGMESALTRPALLLLWLWA